MDSRNRTPRREKPPGAPLAIVFTTSDPSYNFPSWWTRAKVRLQDGGSSSPSSTATATSGGKGGDSGTSWIDIVPGTPISVVVGTGGVGGGAATNNASVAGGLSSVTPRNGQAITSANAQLRMPGGDGSGLLGGVNPGIGGNSMFGTSAYNTAGHIYGGGGAGSSQNSAANSGASGVVIFEYLEP